MVLAAYYRDQLNGQNSHFKVTRPNGSLMFEWDHASPEEHYPSVYWYWNISLPSNAPSGEWLATAGTFAAPVPSDQALSRWGSLTINVLDCTHFDITMDTSEGDKISSTFKIAGVVGLTCVN